MIRDFAQKEVKPMSRILDAKKNPSECISWDLVKKASALGIRTLALPEKWGGADADLVTRMIVQEELGAADVGFADLVRDHGSRMLTLSEDQQKEFMPQYLADDTFLVAGALTEPDHGTDQFMFYEDPKLSMQTYAEKKGDEYIINGGKHFISNGTVAKLYLVHARTSRTLPIKQCETTFIIMKGTPGFTFGKAHDKLGRRLLINGELFFENVHVPARHVVPKPDPAKAVYGGGENGLIIYVGILGFLRCVYEETLSYARTRVQGGKPIIEHVNIAAKIGRMKVQIASARALIYQTAWAWDAKYEYDPKMHLLLKGLINEISVDIVTKASDIHGGLGTDKDLPIEKYIRDAYTTLHGLGTGEMAYVRGAPPLNP